MLNAGDPTVNVHAGATGDVHSYVAIGFSKDETMVCFINRLSLIYKL